MTNTISSVVLEIDDDIIGYKPNSIKITDGDGELVVYPVSKGDGSVDVVFAINDETKVGKVSFELYGTADSYKLKRRWTQARKTGGIPIRLSDNSTGFTKTFKNMSVSNDAEQTISSESAFSVEFQGAPAV